MHLGDGKAHEHPMQRDAVEEECITMMMSPAHHGAMPSAVPIHQVR